MRSFNKNTIRYAAGWHSYKAEWNLFKMAWKTPGHCTFKDIQLKGEAPYKNTPAAYAVRASENTSGKSYSLMKSMKSPTIFE